MSLGAGTFAMATAINDEDVVVGYQSAGAFRWEASTGVVWLDPDSHASANDINDQGEIVGRLRDRAVVFVVPPPGP